MKDKKSYALFGVLIAIIGLGLYYFLKPEAPAVLPPANGEQPAVGNMIYSGNSIIEEQDGRRIWELTAVTIEINQADNQAVMKELKAVFYQKNGTTLQVTAPKAMYHLTTRDLVLDGQVDAATSDGATFRADAARWSGAAQRFYGLGGVVLTRGDTVVIGDQIESDAAMSKVVVTGNARIRKGGTSN